MKVLEWWISPAGRVVQGAELGSKLISLGAKNPVIRARSLHAKLKQRRRGLDQPPVRLRKKGLTCGNLLAAGRAPRPAHPPSPRLRRTPRPATRPPTNAHRPTPSRSRRVPTGCMRTRCLLSKEGGRCLPTFRQQRQQDLVFRDAGRLSLAHRWPAARRGAWPHLRQIAKAIPLKVRTSTCRRFTHLQS
jgi:hypothetical protein